MDAAQLNAVSAVLGAIAASAGAGAGEAVKDMTKASVTGTRDRLIALVRRRLKKDPVGDAKLTVYAAEPTPANGQALQGHLVEAGVDQSQEILTLAREVLAAAGPASLAPGSVAANVIKQINKKGGTGYIGGQHVHHHGAPEQNHVTWDLLRLEGDAYELRNTGRGAAIGVEVTANVEIARLTPPDHIAAGSSVDFTCSPSLADPTPILTVAWTASESSSRQRWQRPLPK